LGESQVRFNRVPEKVWEALVQSQVKFNKVRKKVPEKVWNPVEPDLALHQTFPAFSRTLLNFTGLCTKASQTF
jgi:hypothetical protein